MAKENNGKKTVKSAKTVKTSKRTKTAAKTVIKKKVKYKALKVATLAVLLFLINLYIVLGVLYKEGGFTVTLDGQEGKKSNLVIYESPTDKSEKAYLKCGDIKFISDISVDWIPANINDEADGTHHGRDYMAYTFYAENVGNETINYWITTQIDEMELEVDNAVRFVLYKNGVQTVYAKRAANGNPEPGTVPFKDEKTVLLNKVENFKPGDIDKYTLVVFMEGNDPQCKDDLIGGLISMHMTLTEEHIANQENVQTESVQE